MLRLFNTTGPCIPARHYMLSPALRLGRVMELIDQEKYFTLTAGWQTGKTTSAQWLVQRYNAGDRYACIWVDIQTAREEPEPQAALRTILEKLDHALSRDLPEVPRPDWGKDLNPATALLDYLRDVCARLAR